MLRQVKPGLYCGLSCTHSFDPELKVKASHWLEYRFHMPRPRMLVNRLTTTCSGSWQIRGISPGNHGHTNPDILADCRDDKRLAVGSSSAVLYVLIGSILFSVLAVPVDLVLFSVLSILVSLITLGISSLLVVLIPMSFSLASCNVLHLQQRSTIRGDRETYRLQSFDALGTYFLSRRLDCYRRLSVTDEMT